MIKTLFFVVFHGCRHDPAGRWPSPSDITVTVGSRMINAGLAWTAFSAGREKQGAGAGTLFRAYSMWIASDGQTSTQVWQSTHMSLSTFALSFSMEIADAGHSLTQVSHPVHFSLSTTDTNSFTPSYMFQGREKKCFYPAWDPSGDHAGGRIRRRLPRNLQGPRTGTGF